jgi:hypothetical protein
MAISEPDLDEIFTYHAPTLAQQEMYERIRKEGKSFAAWVLRCTPPCADQTAAIRKIREAVMTANAAVALRGRV